jgi:hypothetical protein
MNDTSSEISEVQFEMMMNLGANRPIELASEMFMAARGMMISSMPSGLSAAEVKRRVYFLTYGEHLPDDVFKDNRE